jgi:hypothetical protein
MPKLTNNERGGFTDAIRLTAADLAAIAAGGAKTIATIPAGGAIELVGLSTSGSFSTTPTGNVSVGISGTTAKYLAAAVPGTTTASAGRYNTGSGFTAGTGVTGSGLSQAIDFVTVDTPVILTAVAGNYSALTSGEIVVAIRILDPVRFNNA